MDADFSVISNYYDLMYVDKKTYQQESEKISKIAHQYNVSDNRKLLDVACGTGETAFFLSKDYQITGIDLCENMLEIARQKVPEAQFLVEDMFDFNLEEKFGVVINLYGSVGFAHTYEQLVNGLLCVRKCLQKGGVFIFTPWGIKEEFKDEVYTGAGGDEKTKFCQMEIVKRTSDTKVQVEMFHSINRNNEVSNYHFIQNITLFSEEEYRQSIKDAGLTLLKRLGDAEFRMGAFICIENDNKG